MSQNARVLIWLALLAAVPVPLLLGLGFGAIRDVERVDREQRVDAARTAFAEGLVAAIDEAAPGLPLVVETSLDAATELADPRLLRSAERVRSGALVEALEDLEPLFAAATPPRLRVTAMLDAARALERGGRANAATRLRERVRDVVAASAAELGDAFARHARIAAGEASATDDVHAWIAEFARRPSSDEEVALAARLLAECDPAAEGVSVSRDALRTRREWPRTARELAARFAAAPRDRVAIVRVRDAWYTPSADSAQARRVLEPAMDVGTEHVDVDAPFVAGDAFVDPGAQPLSLTLRPSSLFYGLPARGLLLGAIAIYGVLALALLRAVSRQQRRSDALAQARADLVAQVTHELRTPLSVVRLYGESLLAGRVAPAAQTEYLETIARESTRLGELVDRVAAVAHAERATAPRPREAIDPGPLVLAEAAVVARVVHQRGGTVDAQDRRASPRCVLVARDELRLVLDVLFDNALRYGGSPPRLDVEVADAGSSVRITIRDHGPGVESRERERVFERFERGSAGVASGTRGAGMGLWLARRAARDAGGDVTLEFPGDGGTRAVVTLPASVETRNDGGRA